MKISRDIPISREEVLELRKSAIIKYGGMCNGIVIPEFTCDTCKLVTKCLLAYDLYNTNGDCLVDK